MKKIGDREEERYATLNHRAKEIDLQSHPFTTLKSATFGPEVTTTIIK